MKEDFLLDLDIPMPGSMFSNMTVPGKIVGTPDYMAPERLRGAPASESTDIYALGVILYQMLTLSFPYRNKKGRKLVSLTTLFLLKRQLLIEKFLLFFPKWLCEL